MTEDTDIPIPVRFNPFKHHRNYILRTLESVAPDMITSLLDPVCNNYIDIYTGTLTPAAIGSSVIDILKSNNVFQLADFTRWVASKNGYQQIQLKDRSEWVVRKSKDVERYIHIHPTRTGPFTIRFKGSTLKTAYLLKTGPTNLQETLSLENVNRMRMQIGLSPVKKLDRNTGILKCYEEFFYHGKLEKKALNKVCFRFYEELNDYLPEEKRKVWFEHSFSGGMIIQDVIGSLGVPPGEIDLILVNQQSKGFDYRLQDGDRISVYPVFELLDLSGISSLREKPLRNPTFICDVHLGRLCKYLRMLGLDTLYSNQYIPEEIIAISCKEKRIILSRSYQLTRHKEVTHSYWIRSSDPLEQVKDLVIKLDLINLADPLTRCLICNDKLVPVEKPEILHRLQERTAKYYNEFFNCPTCNQIYWKGSHFENMLDFISTDIITDR